jgi:hypothetical protein
MLNRMLVLMAGVAMAASATGCCCLSGYNRCCNPCGSYYGGYAPMQCGPGGCAPTYGTPLGPTSYYSPTDAAFAPTTTISAAPVFGPAYPTTALAPVQSLPTY